MIEAIAKEFIILHIKDKNFNLENYIPEGQLKGFPKEIIKRMLDRQEEQGNKKDISVFEKSKFSLLDVGGFDWDKTEENWWFWYKVISCKNFNVFFEKYPKKDNQYNSQEFNLENYVPKGQLTDFPKEIIAKMLDYQQEQGNPRDISVFERHKSCTLGVGGFTWVETKECGWFWNEVINNKNFDFYFQKYPKKEDNQEFRVGDEVYDILCKSVGIVTNVNTDEPNYQLTVNLENGNNYTYTIDGRINHYYKTPQLLHYRDDYDYTTIDFKNLPKRQEKRWRAEEGGYYYFIKRDEYNFNLDKIYKSIDYRDYTSNEQYKIGNYFKTREQAQEIVDQTNTYFQK